MIDRMVFLQRKNTLSIGGFQKHWRDVHGPLAASVRGLRGYVQLDAIGSGDGKARRMPGTGLEIDGIALLVFDDIPAIAAGFTPAKVEALVEDEGKFVERLELATTVANIVVPASIEAAPIRLLSLNRRRSEVDAATFHAEWWRNGVAFATNLPKEVGYIQRIVIEHSPKGPKSLESQERSFEGVEELSFPDEASFERAHTSIALRGAQVAGVGDPVLSIVLRGHRIV
ncbi:EthD domain-containing protein [Bradyrhizobium mercantei]|uniref:EthD domain-containing protein n=1 Tax=Bradyrhizobium mercantei TaxID=1904807 RepID=UPI000976D04D|nr:EthD domain-containing protein [Bradyrhizobium mercantei]